MTTTDPERTVTDLGREWRAALAAERAVWTTYLAIAWGPREAALQRRLDAAGARREACEALIRDTPARSLAEVAIKLRVARQFAAEEVGTADPAPDHPELSTEAKFVLAALADLERLLGDAARAAGPGHAPLR